MMGTAASPTRGRELGFHFSDVGRGFIGHISVLGDMVPVMAGVALSFRLKREARVALAFSGDGATSTGAFHEGLNFAAVLRLPLVIVVESNQYAYSTPARRQSALRHLSDRAAAYGIPALRVDGNDVLAVHHATRGAVDRARAGEGVTLLELETYRRTGHALHDDQRYVPAGEVARWSTENDPLDRYRAWLRGLAWCSATRLDDVDSRVGRELEDALAACAEDRPMDGADAMNGVYSHPPRSVSRAGADWRS
jgi:pyruvate dehydrogenase E1 component alpha subunit/2-oxoisovalerate dehydrogenase E1 component alpha subunit